MRRDFPPRTRKRKPTDNRSSRQYFSSFEWRKPTSATTSRFRSRLSESEQSKRLHLVDAHNRNRKESGCELSDLDRLAGRAGNYNCITVQPRRRTNGRASSTTANARFVPSANPRQKRFRRPDKSLSKRPRRCSLSQAFIDFPPARHGNT